MGMQEGEEIQHPLVSKAIETAQKRVEARNFEIRKHLLEYDDVMNRQRELIYSERDRVLKGEKIKEHVFEMVEDVIEASLGMNVHPDMREEDKNPEGLIESLEARFGTGFRSEVTENDDDLDALRDAILNKIKECYDSRALDFTPERMQFLSCYILLQVLDSKWKDHLHSLDNLKEGIGLRAYGQRDPLIEYKKEAFDLFEAMIDTIKHEAVELIFRVQVVREEKMSSVMATSKTQLLHPESQGLSQVEPPRPSGPGAGLQRPPAGPMPGGFPPQRPQKTETIRRDHPKVGRNDPCPCGSGKKYKKCCGVNG